MSALFLRPLIMWIHLVLFTLIISTTGSCANTTSTDEPSAEPMPDPLGMMLTWQQDPTTTMTIDWHTRDSDTHTVAEYRPAGEEDAEWQRITGEHQDYPFADRLIHRVEIVGLQPDTEYDFRVGEYTRIRKFRTMPTEPIRPIRFATGGDVRHRIDWMEQTNRRAAAYDPDFILWGGDLAYANGLEERVTAWHEFLDATMRTLMTADNRIIPVIAAIGNHEVRGGYYTSEDHESRQGLPSYRQDDASREIISPYFYRFFAFPGQPGYNVLDFGEYMSLVLLDTDHTNPVDGIQTEWLEQVLAERQEVPHLYPVYHGPAWPSVRNPEWEQSVRVREHWVPLFEQYGVRVAFENHDHAYKRTRPIRNNREDPSGVVYFGDGAWGVGVREIGRSHEEPAWYLDRASADRHFILVTIQGPHQHYLVISEDNEIIDEYPETPHGEFERRRPSPSWIQVHENEEVTESRL